jgi:hypothetical protein
MAVKTNAVLRVASDTTWAAALDRARAELDYAPVAMPTAKRRTAIDQLERAVYGPPPPSFDLNWLLTPHPYPEYRRGLITPEICAKLLDVMVANRMPKPRKVAQYARAMIHGNWHFTNQGWAINCDGHFQDGQNRALAAIVAGFTVDCLMCVGMPVRNFPHLDQGSNRSKKDTLDLQGEVNTANLGTSISMVMQYDQWGDDTHLKWRSFSVTNDEVLEALGRYSETIRRGASLAATIRSRVRISNGAFGAAYCILRRIAPETMVESFFLAFRSGANLDDNDPISVLREHFNRRAARGERNYDAFVQLAMIFKAWNYHVNGERVKAIAFPVGREAFPTPEEWR